MAGSSLIGNLAVNLSMETAAFQKGANIAEKRMAQLQGKLGKVGANITKVGVGMSLGITAPLLAFGKGAFQAASDAQELQSAFNETFGSMAGEMNKWAESTGNAMQRSTREIQEGAQTFGLYFNQATKTREEAAKMSQTFTILAQDMASFHNTSGEEAIAALRSGLSGESEPLRRFGVFLSDAAVQAKAAELGIGALGGKLTDQEKIMARYAIIMEATANAQGDVARTSGSTANQLKASQAAWEEMQITIGTKLLPALTPLITAVTNILDKFNQLSPATQTWVVGIGATAAALGPLMLALGPVITGIGTMLPLLVKLGPALSVVGKALLFIAANPVILGLAVVIGSIYLAWKNWDKIEPIVQKMVSGVTAWLQKLAAPFNWVIGKLSVVGKAFFTLYDKVVGHSYIPDMVAGIASSMAELQKVLVDPAISATDKVGAAFQTLGGLVGSLFGQGAGSIVSSLGQLATALAPLFKGGAAPTQGFVGPPMANGGSGVFGGRGGIDRNQLSLNGNPIARVSRGEHFRVTPANENGGARVVIEASPYFDARVEGTAARVAAPMAGRAAMTGAAAAGQAQSMASRRRFP